MRMLVTGAAGFIGSNFVRHWGERHPGDHVVAYDLLTYAGVRENVPDDVPFVQGDIADPDTASGALGEHEIEVVVNFAAESHNSLAVLDPGLFARTNAVGTQVMLEAARRHGVERFHHVSTARSTATFRSSPTRPSARNRRTGRARRTTRRRQRPTIRPRVPRDVRPARRRSATARTTTARTSSPRR